MYCREDITINFVPDHMKPSSPCLKLVFIIFLQPVVFGCLACSMCKVTIRGRTYLGNNEDSWRMGSRIWFEEATAAKLGSLYVGYGNGFPQGGMNEAGLAFDGLTTYPKPISRNTYKKTIVDPLQFIKEIMQTCRTVEEVRRFAIQYNRQPFFNNGEYLFADKLGNYLVMESDTMLMGNQDNYIIANFCPSITSEKEKLNWDRYKRGRLFLDNHKTGLGQNDCLALIDTMHECREKLGDGTMYSFVADLEIGEFSLYFYHDFKHEVKFNLKEELAKGNHMLEMPALFPANAEFKKLIDFKTPQNSVAVLAFLYLCGGLFVFTALYFAVSFSLNRKATAGAGTNKPASELLLCAISVMLLYYVFALVKNQNIFYFDAPYEDYRFSLLNIAAYIPFIMLLLIIPLIRMNIKVFKKTNWHVFSKALFTLNNLTYLILIGLFAYWGLHNVL